VTLYFSIMLRMFLLGWPKQSCCYRPLSLAGRPLLSSVPGKQAPASSVPLPIVSEWSPFLPLVTRDGAVQPGVFGLPNVRTPADLRLAVKTAVQRCSSGLHPSAAHVVWVVCGGGDPRCRFPTAFRQAQCAKDSNVGRVTVYLTCRQEPQGHRRAVFGAIRCVNVHGTAPVFVAVACLV
jgi:hypothetical protein